MAKHVIIKADIPDMNQAWGGKNDTGAAQTILGKTIPAGAVWAIDFEKIEGFLKKTLDSRVGCIRIVPSESGSGHTVLGFKDEDDYASWNGMTDEQKWGTEGQELLVTVMAMPSDAGDTRSVRLQLQSTPSATQPTTDVTIGVKGISQITYGTTGQTEDVAEDLTLQIQTRTSQSGSWITRDSVILQSNQNTFLQVSLKNYLSAGANYVRIRVSGDDGNGGAVSSVWTTLTLNVVALSLISATPVAIPVTGSELELRYYIGGSADKTLRLQFGHYVNSVFVADYSYETENACVVPIGQEVFASVPKVVSLTPTSLSLTNILTEGNHVVRAMLYVSEDVKTDWVETEYMAIPDGEASGKIVVVNNIGKGLENYSDVSFFKWAASESGQVVFRLTNAGDTVEYARWEQTAVAGQEQTLSTQLGIDSEQTEITGYMRIEDAEGNTLHDAVYFAINNNQDFAPVSNPVFILQPSTRSNSEANPRTIVNAATGQVVASEGWDSLDMANDGYKDGALVIPAGSELRIDFNALATLQNDVGAENGLAEKNVTIEVDLEETNITDEEAPVMKLGTYMNMQNDHDIYGLEIRPMEAALMTKNKRVREDQNAQWAEERRTRITVNIVYGLNPDNDPTGPRLNYARIFVNDTIEREFNYNANDSFIKDSDAKLVIGSTGADTRIYGMMVYTKALSTSDVQRDYRAGLATTQQKIDWMNKNDILGQSGEIDFEKAKNAGYNVLGHTGHLPKYGDENSGETKGQVSLLMYLHNDAEHSGTYTDLDNKGQGTTAMTYWDWNQQYKTTASTKFIDSNGVVHSNVVGFNFGGNIIPFPKGVGKINFASSMQGHKMGLTRAYDELFKQMVGDGYLSEPSQFGIWRNAGNAGEPRLTVYEKPFLFFHRETENDPWTFRYLMTFGSAKGDKPTFGFDKSLTSHMMMVEGADNDRQLALFACPWDDDVTYDAEKEAWYIGNVKQINFGFGKTSKVNGEELPSDADALTALKNFFNFGYLHTLNIQCYDATESHLQAGSPYAISSSGYTTPSTNTVYWVSQADPFTGSQKYDLFRYDTLRGEWRAAGMNGAVLNMRTQYEAFAEELSRSTDNWTGLAPAAITASAKVMRTAHFAANAEDYMHVDDGLFHQSFNLFFAGTDNRAKNTYYYVDPVTLKVRWMQDDLDTVLKTNNVGQQRKPYYVEIHDKNQYGEYYWQGEASGLYNLLEEAFSDRLTATMRHMMEAMAKIEGSAINYLVSRVLQAQDYFPATAYNEIARLVYERASIAQSTGEYVNNSAQAITQSNGTQRWSEYQWLVDRVMYISSWCEFGEFASGTNAAGALTWRGQTGTYAFTLTPAKWLYPRVVHGSSTKEASNSAYRVRVPKGQQFAYKAFQNDGDTTISIRGIDYYSEIGDMNVPLSASQQTTFDFAGKRLKKVHVNVNGTDDNLFATQRITVSATNITEFVVRGVDTLTGELDLRQCVRLQTIDLRGDTMASVRLPKTRTLTALHLPATLESLNLTGMTALSTFSLAGAADIITAVIPGEAPASKDIATLLYTEQQTTRKLTSLTLERVDWTNVSSPMLMWLADTETCVITGHITTSGTPVLSLSQILELVAMFGDITSQQNSLYVEYAKTMVYNIGITGQKYFTQTGTAQFGIVSMDSNNNIGVGNNINIVNGKPDLKWTFIIDDGEGGEAESLTSGGITITDAQTGEAVITTLNEDGDETRHILQVTATLVNGTEITRRWKIGLFERVPHRGDFAFADGTFDDDVHPDKTIVGYAIKVTELNGVYTVDVMSDEEVGSWVWGVYPDNTNGIPADMRTAISSESGSISLTDFNAADGQNDLNSAIKTKNMTDRAKSIINGWLKNLWDSIDLTAPAYDSGQTYAVGRTVIQEGDVHLCKIAITEAEAFDSTKWSVIAQAELTKMLFAKQMATNTALPQSRTELNTMMDALVALEAALGASNTGRFRQLFYPTAYECHLYEPTVGSGETLNSQYAKTKWNGPAIGILILIYQMYHASRNKTNNASPSITYANEDNTVTDANYPLMANVIKRYTDAGLNTAVLKLGTNSNYWSVTENLSYNAWYVNFGNGNSTTTYNYYKYNAYVVRPVAAFTYTPSGV